MLMPLAVETSGLSECWVGVSVGMDWIEVVFPFFGLHVPKELVEMCYDVFGMKEIICSNIVR